MFQQQTRPTYDSDRRRLDTIDSTYSGGWIMDSTIIPREKTGQGRAAQLAMSPYVHPAYMPALRFVADGRDSRMRIGRVTHDRTRQQIFPSVFLGAYSGAGMGPLIPSLVAKEGDMAMGLGTRTGGKAANPLSGMQLDRTVGLPEWYTPQDPAHIIVPWMNGGVSTRDYMRAQERDVKCRGASYSF